MPDFFQKSDVSRETISKLEVYLALLRKWQRAVNLVSGSTIDEAWSRHFVDSGQLAPLIPSHVKTLADIGCGAGFPGLVLAIMRPDLNVVLIESDDKKCQFMRTVCREVGVEARVLNMRIEEAYQHVCPDLVTARALSGLDALLGYIAPWAAQNDALEALFLKGGQAQDEIRQARHHYDFDVEATQSVTSDAGKILHIRHARACV